MFGFIRVQFCDWSKLVSDSIPKSGHFDSNIGVLTVIKEQKIVLESEFRKFREFREIRGKIFRISRNSENAKD